MFSTHSKIPRLPISSRVSLSPNKQTDGKKKRNWRKKNKYRKTQRRKQITRMEFLQFQVGFGVKQRRNACGWTGRRESWDLQLPL